MAANTVGPRQMETETQKTSTTRGLRRNNLLVGLAHLVQGVVILALSNGFAIDVGAAFQDGPPGTALPDPEALFSIPYGPAVAAFLFLAAADHLLMAVPRISAWYVRNLRRGINYARWIEYSISASIMVILIAMLTGITGVYALIGLFGVNAAMILFGLLMERSNPLDAESGVDWLPFVFGSIVGIVPWIAISVALGGSVADGSEVPGFVFGIFVSLFVLFFSFAVNQFLQYKRVGRWRDYVFGERAYIWLSLIAKSALAWQVFSGTLAG